MAQTKVKLISNGVIVQGNLHVSHGITTAHIGEGSNLYYTDARVGSYLSTNSFATESYVGTQIANLVDSSPSALNTLNELAAALGDDANFSTTVTNSIALKAPLASPTFTGDITIPQYFQHTGDGNSYFGFGGNDDFRVGVGGVKRLNVHTSGVEITGTIASNNIAITNSGNGELSVTRTSGATVKSIAQSARGQIGTSSNHELQLITNATSRLTISTSGNATFAGNVGVAGKTPAYGLNLAQGTGVGNKIAWTDSTPSFRASMWANSSDDKFKIATGNASSVETIALEIDTSQNATFAQKIIAGGRISTEATTSNALLQVKYNSSNYLEAYYDKLNVVGGNFQFQTAGTTKMVLTTTGNVGIGTTSPSIPLHVYSAAPPGGIGFKTQSGNASNWIQNTSTGSSWQMGSTTAGWQLFNDTASAYRMTITNAGNVGIGTTDPRGKGLEIFRAAGNSSYPQLIISTGESSSKDYGISTDVAGAGDFAIVDGVTNVAANVRLLINSAGNVGIGTTSLTEKLRVQGNSGSDLLVRFQPFTNNATSKLYLSSVSSGDGGYFYNSNDNTSGLFSYGDYAFYVGTSNISGTIGNPRMIIKQDGNVGIGTTSPSSYNSRGRNLVISGAGDVGITIDCSLSNSGTLLFADGTGGTAAYRGSIEYDHADDSMAFSTAAAEQMSIDSSGNVGLGVTSPLAQLDVQLHHGTGAYNKSCGARIGRIQYGWYTGRYYPNNTAFIHIKTNLWMGGSHTNAAGNSGNTQYIMGGFDIQSYKYGPGAVGRGEIKFHNWSGGFASLVVRNTGNWATFVQNPYVSTDGYCVIVLRHDYYSTPNIDFHQSFTAYPWREVQVVTQAQSSSATGVY